MCTTNDKPFLTYEQQIAKLTDKGLTISNPSEATFLLKQHSYFALISGYKSPFKAKNGAYKLHTQMYRYMGFPANWREIKSVPLGCNILRQQPENP